MEKADLETNYLLLNKPWFPRWRRKYIFVDSAQQRNGLESLIMQYTVCPVPSF